MLYLLLNDGGKLITAFLLSLLVRLNKLIFRKVSPVRTSEGFFPALMSEK